MTIFKSHGSSSLSTKHHLASSLLYRPFSTSSLLLTDNNPWREGSSRKRERDSSSDSDENNKRAKQDIKKDLAELKSDIHEQYLLVCKENDNLTTNISTSNSIITDIIFKNGDNLSSTTNKAINDARADKLSALGSKAPNRYHGEDSKFSGDTDTHSLNLQENNICLDALKNDPSISKVDQTRLLFAREINEKSAKDLTKLDQSIGVYKGLKADIKSKDPDSLLSDTSSEVNSEFHFTDPLPSSSSDSEEKIKNPEQKSSLIDDYADVSQDMPSYMDPED